MAHVAILSLDEVGHLFPLGAVGRELVRRGHRVTIVGPARSARLAAALDLPLHELAADSVAFPSPWGKWLVFSVLGAGWMPWLQAEFSWAAQILLREAPEALQKLNVDGVLIDESRCAGGTVAERLGLPYVTVSTTLTWREEMSVPPMFTGWDWSESRRARLRNRMGYAAWRWFTHPMLKTINRFRRKWDLQPFRQISDTHSPLAHLGQSCPEFDHPRRELPDTFHYVGALASARPGGSDSSFPWQRLDGRPLVFASLGTVSDAANLPVYPKIAAACAGLDAQLVVTLGRWHDKHFATSADMGTLPGNPLLVDFAPQLELLDRAALLITHAGMNSTLESLSRGVPMVAMPRSGDQLAVASLIQSTGVGVRAPFYGGSADEVRRAVERVLVEDRFRTRAKELQQALHAAGGVRRAADIVETAIATRRPVRHAPSARIAKYVGDNALRSAS